MVAASRSAEGEPVATQFQRQPAQATGLLPVAVTGPAAVPVPVPVPVLQLALAPPPAAGTGSAPGRSSGLVAGSRRGLVRSIGVVAGFVPARVPGPLPEIAAASRQAVAPSLGAVTGSGPGSVAGVEAAAADSGQSGLWARATLALSTRALS